METYFVGSHSRERPVGIEIPCSSGNGNQQSEDRADGGQVESKSPAAAGMETENHYSPPGVYYFWNRNPLQQREWKHAAVRLFLAALESKSPAAAGMETLHSVIFIRN